MSGIRFKIALKWKHVVLVPSILNEIFMKFRIASLVSSFAFLVCLVSCGDRFSESKFTKLENRTTTKQVRALFGQPDKEYVASSKDSPYISTVWVYIEEEVEYFIYFTAGSVVGKKKKDKQKQKLKQP